MHTLLDRKHTSMMLIVVFFATFMDGLDGSVVNVALPDIGTTFEMDTATVSWVSITYMMVLAGTLVAFARVAADTGVKRIMSVGLLIFTISSFLCGISVSFPMLIASRVVQAIGAGMMAASGPMCCTEHLPAGKLAFGLSIVTIGASLGFALGPAVGGVILEITSWHWIFLMNLPLGAIAIPLMLKAIPPGSEKGGKTDLDLAGTALLFASIVLITFAVETLSYSDMGRISVSSAVIGIMLLFVFAKIEREKKNPLLQVSLFRRWDFTSVFACLMIVNMVYMGLLYLLPFYGEICLDMSALSVGLVLAISAVVSAVFGMPMARWSDRTGRRVFCVTAGLFTVASSMLLALLTEYMTLTSFALIMIPMGLGWACVGGPMASRLVEHAGDERDMASSLTNEAYYIGGAIGTALAAMSFTLFSSTDGIDIQDVSKIVFENGFMPTSIMFAGLAIVIVVLSFIVKDRE